MQVEIVVPGVGESVSEGMLTRWLKRAGDSISKDEPVAELETDKATVEIVSPAAGVLETLVAEGTVVKVHSPIARVDTEGSPSVSPAPEKQEHPSDDALQRHGPAVGRISRETGISPESVEGTGRGGRVTKADMVSASLQRAPGAKEREESERARAKGEELRKEEAKGIRPEDARAPVSERGPDSPRSERRKPMTMIRRRIAERLLAAQQNAAILTTFNEIDMSAVQRLREQYKTVFEEKHGLKLGFMGFFVKAVTEALREFPEVNARIEGSDVIYQDYCDVGVAVSTEKGLMVPVLRDAERLSLAGVEAAIAAFSRKAREGKISVDDLAGGTFSITNGGVFGSLLSTPILNPPQSAILGMHKIQTRPVCLPDGRIEGRPMMYVALSYDHRLIDGRDAVGFLVKVKERVEDPARLLLGV